jgi:hypothetical protein
MEVTVPPAIVAAEKNAGNRSIGALMQVSMHHGMLQTSDTELRTQAETRGDIALPWAIGDGRLQTHIDDGTTTFLS